jgi:hypothetical protein
LGKDTSTISRTLKRARQRIKRFMKYFIWYWILFHAVAWRNVVGDVPYIILQYVDVELKFFYCKIQGVCVII